jgi:acetyl esterase/lipase
VSEGWLEFFRTVPDPATKPKLPDVDDLEAWRDGNRVLEAERLAMGYGDPGPGVEVAELEVGGAPVLEVRPQGWDDDGGAVLYTHGGGYVAFSARSTVRNAALVARAAGLRVLSIDYTLAPFSRWEATTDQVVAVFDALIDAGTPASRIAMYGESAGGSLAAGSVLKMRDGGREMPVALVMWSPWSDITNAGDSYRTLADVEGSYLYELHLAPAAEAYAGPDDLTHPYVSPVYGDYSPGFPPTLIQGGTREIFLSNFIRHYRALDDAGIEVELDLYEGMPHVFQNKLPESPESKRAVAKTAEWIRSRLG